MMMDVTLNKGEVAQLLKVTKSTVDRNLKRGLLPKPSYAAGPRSPRWLKSEIMAVLNPSSQVEALNESR